jgi:MFS transporter, PPP family, 3-phenylpropionic acid transporter
MVAKQPSLVWSKAFYFCFYAAGAALMPFLALYYEGLGLSGRQIGFLAGISPLASLVGAPLWGGLADITRRHKLIWTITITGTITMALVLSQTTVFLLLIPIVIVYALFSSPIIPLADNAVMALLAERKDQYGRQRIWGAIGWGIAAPLIGLLIENRGLNWSFWGYSGIMFVGLLIVQKIPFRQASIQVPFWRGARTLLSNRSWLLFLLLVFFGGAGGAVIHNYLFLYMNELGASKTMMGLALTVATLSELPMYFFADRLLARWSAKGLFIFGTLMYILRALALSFIQMPWMILVTQLLHGLTFSAMWVAGVSYADEIAPPGLGATAQGMLSGVFMGISAAIGAMLGGVLYQDFGGAIMYRTMAIAAAISVLIYFAAQWKFTQTNLSKS